MKLQRTIGLLLMSWVLLSSAGGAGASSPTSGPPSAPATLRELPAGAVFDAALARISVEGTIAPPRLPGFPNHPGWPVAVQGGASPPVCADLDPSYPGLEIVVGTLTSAANLYVFHQDGSLMAGYPVDLGFWIAASPSVGDINGDGRPEIVVGDFGGNQVWALHADGTPLPGWPIPVGANVRSTAALADLDPTVPGLEVIVGVQDGTVQAWHADGTSVAGWPVTAGNFVERCSPAVGDVNGDGFLEVFVGSWYDYGANSTGGVYGFDHHGVPLSGWPQLTNHTSVIASPVLADLDGDGRKEIITGTYETNAKIYVWHDDGSLVSGWPYTINRGASSTSAVSSSPAVCDLDHDGSLDIIAASCGQCGSVYALKRDGTVLPGWPFLTNVVVDGSSPVLGDLDGDGRTEIVVGSGSGFTPFGCTTDISKAYVLRDDGTLLPGWPVDLGTATPPCPALADVDGDGNVEVVMAYAQTVYVWDAPGAYSPQRTPWPYYHLGVDHTGDFSGDASAAVATYTPAAAGRLIAWPNPLLGGGPVLFRQNGREISGRIDILDPAGRVIRSLAGQSWDGSDTQGRAVRSGLYLIRRPGSAAAGSVVVIRR